MDKKVCMFDLVVRGDPTKEVNYFCQQLPHQKGTFHYKFGRRRLNYCFRFENHVSKLVTFSKTSLPLLLIIFYPDGWNKFKEFTKGKSGYEATLPKRSRNIQAECT